MGAFPHPNASHTLAGEFRARLVHSFHTPLSEVGDWGGGGAELILSQPAQLQGSEKPPVWGSPLYTGQAPAGRGGGLVPSWPGAFATPSPHLSQGLGVNAPGEGARLS